MHPRVVLYNPRAVFWTMPLALIALGSALDRSKYDVVIVDGRLEADPLKALLNAIDDQTICLGLSVLTGAPIRDALLVTRAIHHLHPHLPIIWGGWHPSLFPEQCLTDANVYAAVVGQGEETFAEIVERVANKESLEGIKGCVHRASYESHPASIIHNPPRHFRNINELPPHDYTLIDAEQYFARKGKRQFDYISSQGCRFRCAFCADPAVYQRGWFGLEPERMVRELVAHHAKYRFEEVSFQDETFFTSRARVEAIAEAFLSAGLKVVWTATMRSDQGARLDDALMAKCKRAGLKRVMIGIESGAPEMLKRIQKDITLEQVFESAEKCARHRIGAILNFIVGFPDEPEESIQQTLDLAAKLRTLSPDFEVSVFYFRPYPGNPIADALLQSGYRFPTRLEEWAEFDYVGGRGEWITPEQWQRVEAFKFYQRFAFGHNQPLVRWPLRWMSRWRLAHNFYSFPIEKIIIEKLRPAPKLS